MGEIKFRAWIKDYYKHKWYMIKVEYPYFLDNGKLQELVWDSVCDFSGKCRAIMQYTRLKDKNGKEIWEGDIVKAESILNSSLRNIRPILFHSSAFWWGGMVMYAIPTEAMEVIGNIYENPKLL